MNDEGIPPEVRNFLADHIDSVLALEVLLLLRANPDQTWTARQLSDTLKIDPAWAEEQLKRFSASAILSRTGESTGETTYRYAPPQADLDSVIARVDDCYIRYRVTLIGLIFSKPQSNLKSFSDAFRLRKGSEEGGST